MRHDVVRIVRPRVYEPHAADRLAGKRLAGHDSIRAVLLAVGALEQIVDVAAAASRAGCGRAA